MNKKVPFFYYLMKFILAPIFKLWYNPTIIGKENIPIDGSIVICGNHKHLFDQCLIVIATKRGIHYMAKKEYFTSRKTRWFFKMVGCISVDRTKKDEESKRLALSVLKDGGAIGIFPEGTRNKTNKKLLDFKYGAVSLASKTSSYIVPFAILGDYKFRSKNLKVIIGKKYKVSSNLEEENKKLYHKVLELMEFGET